MTKNDPRKIYDVLVVGGGFAGLSAAMNAASENKSVLLLESRGISGGQGGTTSAIQNYFGFPNGIAGQELASLGLEHCQKLGVEFLLQKQAIRLTKDADGTFNVLCGDRDHYFARSVIAACGLKYRQLGVPGEQRYMGNGVGHGFPPINNLLWKDKRVVVVGGGNSGAQCCLFLSGCENCHVTFVVRGKSLGDTMSGMYLKHFAPGVLPNFNLCMESSVHEIIGDSNKVTKVTVKGPEGARTIETDHVCVMIGAVPYTGWLEECAALDSRNFVLTDRDVPEAIWPLKTRQPHFCETSVPGLFAVGDVRKGNERRRATSAVADGMQGAASAVQCLSDFDLKQAPMLVKSA